MSGAERSAKFREEKRKKGMKELRNQYIYPEDFEEHKANIARVNRRTERRRKSDDN